MQGLREPFSVAAHCIVQRRLPIGRGLTFYHDGSTTMTHRFTAVTLIAATLLTLAACGRDPGTRAVTGGLIGAGGGAAIGAATGGNPGTGALIGGAVGAVGGAATTPR